MKRLEGGRVRARMAGLSCAVWVGLLGIGGGSARAQTDLPPLPPRPSVPAAISFLSPLILPKLLSDTYLLREFVRSEELAGLRRAYGDVYGVDLIFDKAMRLSWDNVYEALLITTFAVMDHEKFGIRVPGLGDILWLPLTSEFSDEFRARRAALPRRIYPDTPPGEAGDKDKLQHFFGSAFLTFISESAEAADRLGVFVELGEEKFIVDGAYDERDLRADRQGQLFATRLRLDSDARPSGALLAYVRPSAPSAADSIVLAPDQKHLHVEAK